MTRLLSLTLGLLCIAVASSAQVIQLPVSPMAPLDFLQLTAPDGRWAITLGPTTNPGDSARPDTAMTWGWNTKADGGRLDSSEPALMYRVENYYRPPGSDAYLESHLQYVSAAGTVFRPLGFQITRGTNYIYGQLLGDAWNYLSTTGTQYLKLMPSELQLKNGMIIEAQTNNNQPYRQAKANGSLASLINLDASDRPVVGDSSHGTGHIVLDTTALELGGSTGTTLSGTSCAEGQHITVTEIKGGLIMGAACVP